jgi:hypothetical protein
MIVLIMLQEQIAHEMQPNASQQAPSHYTKSVLPLRAAVAIWIGTCWCC